MAEKANLLLIIFSLLNESLLLYICPFLRPKAAPALLESIAISV